MLVLDSNVWIYLATAGELPVEIYSETLGERLYFPEEFYRGRHETVLSAYMIEEIRQGLGSVDTSRGGRGRRGTN